MIRDFEIVTEGDGEEAFGQARMTPMTRDFNVIIERDTDGYYVATVPDLKGCHTQAKSLDKLMERVREAIELCLEVEGEDEGHEELDFVGVQRVKIAR
jgi:predicted RNase H-like HicB family nuclease